MDKDIIKNLFKSVMFGIVWAGLASILAMVIVEKSKYTFIDAMFIEGLALIMLGLFSTIGGDPMGLPNMLSSRLGASYSQYANLEVTRNERKFNKDMIKRTVIFGVSSVAFIVGGIISVAISFI